MLNTSACRSASEKSRTEPLDLAPAHAGRRKSRSHGDAEVLETGRVRNWSWVWPWPGTTNAVEHRRGQFTVGHRALGKQPARTAFSYPFTASRRSPSPACAPARMERSGVTECTPARHLNPHGALVLPMPRVEVRHQRSCEGQQAGEKARHLFHFPPMPNLRPVSASIETT